MRLVTYTYSARIFYERSWAGVSRTGHGGRMSCESLVGNDSFAFLEERAICKRASAHHRGLHFSDIRCLPEDPSNVEISRIWNAKLYGQIRSPRACVLHSGNEKQRDSRGEMPGTATETCAGGNTVRVVRYCRRQTKGCGRSQCNDIANLNI